VSDSLFAFDFSDDAFRPGDIVRQAWPWILCHNGRVLMPFWQVHHLALWQGRQVIYCRAVPFTTGCGEMHAFEAKDLVRTGQSWRVPDYGEVQRWFMDLGTTEFVAHLNGRPPPSTHPSEGELVELLAHLGPSIIAPGQRAFYEHFPEQATS